MNKLYIREKAIVSGATAFFRNRILFQTVLNFLGTRTTSQKIKILFHSCSAGAEVYSFLIMFKILNNPKAELEVFASDRFQNYLDIAKEGCFNKEELAHLSNEELSYFTIKEDGKYQICDEIRKHVTFLPATDFRLFSPREQFDAVFILNSICYVSRKDQSKVLNKVAKYCKQLLVISGFHQETIKSDIIRSGFSPFLENQEEIHNSWSFRLRPRDTFLKSLRIKLVNFKRYIIKPNDGKLHTESSIPPFSKIKDSDYKYCSLFIKSDSRSYL